MVSGARTMKRAELTVFLCLFRGIIGPTTAHAELVGFWRGAMKCMDPNAKDVDLWILIWEEVHRVHQEGTILEVERFEAHCTMKEKQEMTLFEKFVTESNERDGNRRSNVGWKRNGAYQKWHSLAEQQGGSRDTAVRDLLSLFGARMARW